MNREPLKNYFLISFLYIILIALSLAYGYIRAGSIDFDFLLASIGYVGITLAGFFLISKTLGRIFPLLNSWPGEVASAGTLGLAGILVNLITYWLFPLINAGLYSHLLTTPLIFLPIIILLVIGFTLLILYSDGLLESKFPNLKPNLKYWEVFVLSLIFLLVVFIDSNTAWTDWFKYILNIDNSTKKPLLPPITLINCVFILITLLMFLWEYFAGSNNTDGTLVPPISPPLAPGPEVPSTPATPMLSTPPAPAVPPPAPNTPQNPPVKSV